MNEPDSMLRTLHRVYCETSGHAVPYITCERRLFDFMQAGFAEDDLRLVIDYIKRVNRKREVGYQMPLRFGKLMDLEFFGDVLGESRAAKRASDFKTRHSYCEDKASVLRATGRADSPELPPPQQAKQVMEGLLRKGFEDALKEAEESRRISP